LKLIGAGMVRAFFSEQRMRSFYLKSDPEVNEFTFGHDCLLARPLTYFHDALATFGGARDS
jgi:hypothetical protein